MPTHRKKTRKKEEGLAGKKGASVEEGDGEKGEKQCVYGVERERKKMTEFIVQIYETLNKILII